jgi:serine/threonine-protein kinase
VPEVGKVIAKKYRLVRMIGEGGMGQVFEAIYERLGKRVAIKILHPEYALKEMVTARFEREARAAGLIGHPGIIDIYDIGSTDDGNPFLIMEFLQGQSLSELLDQKFQLDVKTTVGIACQVLSALVAAHDAGVVHRDLKPENIFLNDTQRTTPEVKLLDFGISKFIEDELGSASTRLTKTGTVLGTPLYMSPEQARGESRLDHRVDIYAMGVILYECLTGNLPFTGHNYNDLLINIVTQTPMEPSALVDSIPKNLERIILRAMDREPENRFPSANVMLSELLPFLDEQQSLQIPLTEELRTETQKHRALSAEEARDILGKHAVDALSATVASHTNDKGAKPAEEESLCIATVQDEKPVRIDEAQAPSPLEPLRPTKAETPPAASRQRMSLGIVAALIGVGVVLGIGGWLWLGRPVNEAGGSTASTDGGVATTDVGPDVAMASIAPVTSDAQVEAASDGDGAPLDGSGDTGWVEVRLSATPRAAKIYLDDGEVPSNPYVGRFPRDGLSHRVMAKAAGYEDRGVVVSFDEVNEVELELQRGRGHNKRREVTDRPVPSLPGDDPWRDAQKQLKRPPGGDDPWRDTR